MCHVPFDARTTESAMARPRPVPPGWSTPRWKRSNTSERCSGGIPGPLSSTWRTTRPPAERTRTTTRPVVPAYLQALSTRTPTSRSIQVGSARTRPSPSRRRRFAASPAGWPPPVESVPSWKRPGGDVSLLFTWLDVVPVVCPGQPQEVAYDLAEASPFVIDPAQDGLVLLGRTRPAAARTSTSACMTLSGVRSSCDASAVNSTWRRWISSQRRRCPQADDQRADEGHRGQGDAEENLGIDQRTLGALDLGHALPGDEPLPGGSHGVEPERRTSRHPGRWPRTSTSGPQGRAPQRSKRSGIPPHRPARRRPARRRGRGRRRTVAAAHRSSGASIGRRHRPGSRAARVDLGRQAMGYRLVERYGAPA